MSVRSQLHRNQLAVFSASMCAGAGNAPRCLLRVLEAGYTHTRKRTHPHASQVRVSVGLRRQIGS